MAGDDAQARVFCREALRLLLPEQCIEKVVYSDPAMPAFDDVVVYYESGSRTQDGYPIAVDGFQVKFSVTGARGITGQDLMNPTILRRQPSGNSLLQDLLAVARVSDDEGVVRRCTLQCAWHPQPGDPLSDIWKRGDGSLDLSRLYEAGRRSKLGKLRIDWMNHLGLTEYAELENLLRVLRIRPLSTLQELAEALNDRLCRVGLDPVACPGVLDVYDDLVRKAVQCGVLSLGKPDLISLLVSAGLPEPNAPPQRGGTRIGIRSFARGAETIEEETAHLLCMLDLFNGRTIREPGLWCSEVSARVEQFGRTLPRSKGHYAIDLQTHSSIAFLAGRCLDSKSGLVVHPVQRTTVGEEIWDARSVSRDPRPEPQIGEVTVGQGNELAIALSFTHDITDDVIAFLRETQLPVGRVLEFRLGDHPRGGCVRDGAHALMLASLIRDQVTAVSTAEERAATLHVFAAAPNGLMFRLGQLSRVIGSCQLYEHNFESNAVGAYSPSIEFSVVEAP